MLECIWKRRETGNNIAGINAEECESADIRVCRDLECESTHRSFGRWLAGLHLVGVTYGMSLDRTCIKRAGKICANIVKQALYAFVLER